jgi:CrcB protein
VPLPVRDIAAARFQRNPAVIWSRTLLVALGGVLGCILRYWLAGIVQRYTDTSVFPTGTLAVNVIGSFVVGLVMSLSLERGLIGDQSRILLTTGFCGGFTTMSTFSYETVRLMQDGEGLLALANTSLTVVVCFVAVWIGIAAGRLS